MPSVLKCGVDVSESSACIDYGLHSLAVPRASHGGSVIKVKFYDCNLLHSSVPLIYWISNTLSQVYTDVQSLVTCLGHRDIVSDTGCIPLLDFYAEPPPVLLPSAWNTALVTSVHASLADP